MKKTLTRQEFLQIVIGGSVLARGGLVTQKFSLKAPITSVMDATDKVQHNLLLVIDQCIKPTPTNPAATSPTSISPIPKNCIVCGWERTNHHILHWGQSSKTDEKICAGSHIESWNCSFFTQLTGFNYFFSNKKTSQCLC